MDIKEKTVSIYKKILKISTDVSNFVFTFLIYFLGVSISHVLWRIFKKMGKKSNTYWLKSKQLPEKKEEYHEQF